MVSRHRNRIVTRKDCLGPHCCIHSPSGHPLRDAPMNLRADRGIMERMCPHGIGYPDPDDAAYRRTLKGSCDPGVHGCDGCCREERAG